MKESHQQPKVSQHTLSAEDRALGMGSDITRRDFVQGAGGALLASALGSVGAGGALGATETQNASSEPASPANYPPTRTGMRGSHPGSYDVAHALAREGKSFPPATDLDESYDLVVVGAGISGLAAAHYYRQRFGDDSRILILDNHDDFGGHAKRNEFHQGGRQVLSLGGTHNLEWWKFSDVVTGFLDEHGVDPKVMREKMDFRYGRQNGMALWFDKETFGEDKLIPQCRISDRLAPELFDQMPISEAARASLKAFYAADKNLFPEMNAEALEGYLRSISYPEFLARHAELTDDAIALYAKEEHGSWGLEMRALSAMEAMESGMPGGNLIGRGWNDSPWNYRAALWPDGNASLARLQVAGLIPHVAPGTDASNVATAEFDYSALDQSDNNVRLRLNSTVIRAENVLGGGVHVTYVNEGQVLRVKARHSVLACYHVIMPHLCPELPDAQKDAMKYQVKHPLVLTNVLLRNTKALDALGVDGIRCPGRLHQSMFTFRGHNTGGFEHPLDDDGPVAMVFWGMVSPPAEAVDVHSQLRASRAALYAMTFEDFEREVRTVLKGLLGPAGFDVEKDILAITVNRWGHGYAYEYLDLWDEDWPEGQAPHEIARKPFGAITIANSDSAALAYTHNAIEEAHRAVGELPA